MTSQIGTVLAAGDRSATVARQTKETQIKVTLRLDGTGETNISTGIGFYDHLLNSMAHHALFDLDIEATGDLVIDEHHTVEDVALVFGAALAAALDDRAGIVRFGDASIPMDEALATAVVDVGGRPYAVIDLPFKGKRAGKLTLDLIVHVFESVARAGGLTLHMKGRGRNDHHLAEAAFKALGRSLRAACAVDPRRAGAAASTKGALG
jgi:imidazoleglycerol-phosphate dehydratase